MVGNMMGGGGAMGGGGGGGTRPAELLARRRARGPTYPGPPTRTGRRFILTPALASPPGWERVRVRRSRHGRDGWRNGGRPGQRQAAAGAQSRGRQARRDVRPGGTGPQRPAAVAARGVHAV